VRALRCFLILTFAALALCLPAAAQFDLVTGQVVDPNGIPYSGATLRAQLVVSGTAVTGQPTVSNANQAQCISARLGNAPCQMPFPGTNSVTLDVNGNIPAGGLNLANNPSVTPAGTQWLFSVTISPGIAPPAGTGPQSFSVAMTINSNPQSVTAALTAAAPKLSNLSSSALVTIVSSNPGTCTTGTVYFNTTTDQLLVCSSTNTLTVVGGTGSVTSVGMTLPPQFIVSGSPVTTAGTLAGTLAPEYPDTVFAGPATNSIGGIFDGAAQGTAAGSTSLTLSLTPNTTHDIAFFVSQADVTIGQSSAITMSGSGTWTNIFQNGNYGALFSQLLSTNSALTASSNLSTATNWAGILFFLVANGTPAVVQSHQVSGAVNSGVTNTFLSNTTIGNSILVCVVGAPSTVSTVNAVITDSQGNLYTPIGTQQSSSGGGEVSMCFLTSNINGATHDVVTFTVLTGPGVGSATFEIMEISGIATATGQPGFRPLVANDLPAALNSPPVRQFNTVSLSSNVTVSTSATTITSITVTMPATGCPCRAFVSYSLYYNGDSFTNESAADVWVSDGTNTYAGLQTGDSNASSGGRTSMSLAAFSPVDYTNGQVVTFTLLGQYNTASDFLIEAAPQTGAGPNSTFQVVIMTSN
jgi:hypothetical protein